MKRIDYRHTKIVKISFFVGIVVSLSVMWMVYILSKSALICGLTGFLICVLGSVFLYIIHDMKKSVEELVGNISQNLDDMILGRKTISLLKQSELVQSLIEKKMEQLYAILQKSRDNVISEKQEIQEIISDISHQAKTPITTIKIQSDILEQLVASDNAQAEILSDMNIQIGKLEFLLQSLVKMSRLEVGTYTMVRQEKLLYHTIEESLKGIIISAENKNLYLRVDCPMDICVYHDAKWTAEAVFNMLDNAVKYTDEGGKITIVVRKLEMYTQIEISDTGRGIELQHQADIFKRFYREKAVHHVDGIGLGLYLSKKIFELQGGFIDVQSIPNEGSVFDAYIPNYHD